MPLLMSFWVIASSSRLTLVADPFRLRDELGPRNARRIAAVGTLDDDDYEAWLLRSRT